MGFFLVKHGMTVGSISLFISFVTLALAGHDYRIIHDVTYGNAEADVSQLYLNIYTLREITIVTDIIVPAMFIVSSGLLVVSYRQRRKIYA